MKLNVIFVFRTISSIKLQKIHFNIIDFNVSGNQGVTPNIVDLEKEKMDEDAKEWFLLQQKMDELDLNNECETESDEVIEISPEIIGGRKIQKQRQITV